MWLIDARTRQLKAFVGDRVPAYNILSHTWGDEEVTFQDMQNGVADQRKAFHKIVETCRLSLNPPEGTRVCEWAWVDTCCIDKSSSAELSEAINSEPFAIVCFESIANYLKACFSIIEMPISATFI